MRIAFHLAAALASLPAAAWPAQPQPSLAERLIAERPAPADAAALGTLYRLELAAGRWEEAEATIGRLQATLRPTSPGRANALLPLRVYARGMRYEAAGASSREALDRAFGEIYAALPDREMAAVLPWFGVDFGRLQAAVIRAQSACAGMAVDRCPAAAELLAARQSAAAWHWLLPAAEPLIRADLARRFIVDDRLLIATPDGAEIAAILIRPRGAAPQTSILNFTIYARDEWAVADAATMAANGYAGIVAYSRGKGRSRGPAVPYLHDGDDAVAVIEWLARQPWSDGRVGMIGGSYNASAAWAAAGRRPAPLRAIATNASNAPGIDTPMQGNVFQSFIYPWPLYTSSTRGLDEENYGDSARWTAANREYYRTGRPYRDLDLIDGQPNPVFRSWLDHPSYDGFWQRLTPQREAFARIDIPVFVQTGFFDGGMVGALHYMREHLLRRPDADHRLLVGPYHHTAMQTGVLPVTNGYAIDPAALIDLQDVRLRWLDHIFRGGPLPEILSARVNYQLMGANVWRHVDAIGDMATGPLRLYLSGRREGDRYLFADTAAAGPELRVDFSDRADADFQPPANGLDTRGAIIFQTAPFTRAIEIGGGFTGRFEVVTNKRDFDLAVAFFEARADGSYLPLSSYLGRASYMDDRSRRRLLAPGRPLTLRFESQTITARLVPAGSRIVAVVGAPKQPDIQINYGTGRDVSGESIADAGEPLSIRWLPGSWLELKVRR